MPLLWSYSSGASLLHFSEWGFGKNGSFLDTWRAVIGETWGEAPLVSVAAFSAAGIGMELLFLDKRGGGKHLKV